MTDYEKYQLQWMINHGYSLKELMDSMTSYLHDSSWEVSDGIQVLFNEWEKYAGFDSEIWACEDEWKEVDSLR